ncbi:hypothetical protein HDU76_009842 [Blyttiomyces sp. JEL0837]|nr:hypothetical protein HDU76_009842 [Blyttiomyces sp. JEL0837]
MAALYGASFAASFVPVYPLMIDNAKKANLVEFRGRLSGFRSMINGLAKIVGPFLAGLNGKFGRGMRSGEEVVILLGRELQLAKGGETLLNGDIVAEVKDGNDFLVSTAVETATNSMQPEIHMVDIAHEE